VNASAATTDVRADSPRQLRLVANPSSSSGQETTGARRTPALAVLRLERTSTRTLPTELARRLIAHYSDRGDLIVAAAGASVAVLQARRLGRRALPPGTRSDAGHNAGIGRDALAALRPNERADLAIVVLNADANAQGLSDVAARLGARLRPGGFLVLALDNGRAHLGPIVHACQQQGLQYWQHIVAIDPLATELAPSEEIRNAAEDRRPLRCHRDLLAFRRPVQVDAAASETVPIRERAA
jgi:hypothetical protein